MSKSEEFVSLISCRYVSAMADQFYHVVLPDFHMPRTSAIFYCLPTISGLQRDSEFPLNSSSLSEYE